MQGLVVASREVVLTCKSLSYDTLVSMSMPNLLSEASKEQMTIISRILFPTTLGGSKMLSYATPHGEQIISPPILLDFPSYSSTSEERRV